MNNERGANAAMSTNDAALMARLNALGDQLSRDEQRDVPGVLLERAIGARRARFMAWCAPLLAAAACLTLLLVFPRLVRPKTDIVSGSKVQLPTLGVLRAHAEDLTGEISAPETQQPEAAPFSPPRRMASPTPTAANLLVQEASINPLVGEVLRETMGKKD